MAQRCATLAEFLALAPEFLTAGTASAGSLVFVSQPSPGDSVTLATQYGIPLVTETYIADTDFDIGVNEAATAANFAAAVSLRSLALGTADAEIVTVVSQSTGPVSVLLTTSSSVAMVWDDPTLLGGDTLAKFQLQCACSSINLECWGAKSDCGHVYLTGHMMATAGFGSGEQGTPTAKSIDKLSESYASSTPSDGDYGSTKWGRLYLQLRDTLVVGGTVGRCTMPIVC